MSVCSTISVLRFYGCCHPCWIIIHKLSVIVSDSYFFYYKMARIRAAKKKMGVKDPEAQKEKREAKFKNKVKNIEYGWSVVNVHEMLVEPL